MRINWFHLKHRSTWWSYKERVHAYCWMEIFPASWAVELRTWLISVSTPVSVCVRGGGWPWGGNKEASSPQIIYFTFPWSFFCWRRRTDKAENNDNGSAKVVFEQFLHTYWSRRREYRLAGFPIWSNESNLPSRRFIPFVYGAQGGGGWSNGRLLYIRNVRTRKTRWHNANGSSSIKVSVVMWPFNLKSKKQKYLFCINIIEFKCALFPSTSCLNHAHCSISFVKLSNKKTYSSWSWYFFNSSFSECACAETFCVIDTMMWATGFSWWFIFNNWIWHAVKHVLHRISHPINHQ